MADTNPVNQNSKPNDARPGLSWSQPQTGQVISQQKTAAAKQTTTATPTNTTGRTISIIVGVVVLFALAAWGVAALNNKDDGTVATTSSSETTTDYTDTLPVTNETSTEVATPMNGASSAVFTTATTEPVGTSVTIATLALSQPTWIVVYEGRNGKPGNILGAGLFFPSDTSGVVSLLRSTTAGMTYYITALTDNNDRLFNVADEKVIMDASGMQMWTTFMAQ